MNISLFQIYLDDIRKTLKFFKNRKSSDKLIWLSHQINLPRQAYKSIEIIEKNPSA